MATFLFAPTPNQEAADFIASKPAVSRAVFNRLLPELKARAYCITGIESADVLQRTRDTIAELPAGGDWEDLKGKVLTEISPYLVDPEADAEEKAGQEHAAERRAELLLRTHGQQAYAAAQDAMLEEQKELFPFWQYLSLGDDHVRPTHQALNGVVLPADHEFWKTHRPPWDWGCRCVRVPLTRGDTARIEKSEADKPKDQQSVLDSYAQRDLTDNRRLVRNGVTYNMTAPIETGKPGAYSFDPSNLRITPAQLKARYDPQTWRLFEQWARKAAPFADHPLTIWDWMTGQPVPNYETDTDETAQKNAAPSGPEGSAYRADERASRRAGEAVGTHIYGGFLPPYSGANATQLAGAEIGAVGANRKPLYHEQVESAEIASLAAEALRQRLPAGVIVAAHGRHLMVYRPELVKTILDSDPGFYRPQGEDDAAAVARACEQGINGELLGYGTRTMFQPENVSVYFTTPDFRLIGGFFAPRTRAEELARERGQDYARALKIPVFYHIRDPKNPN